MKSVTYNKLCRLNACDRWLFEFQKVFGERMVINAKNLAKARERNMPVSWFLGKVKTEQYERLLKRLANRYTKECEVALTSYRKSIRKFPYHNAEREKCRIALENSQDAARNSYLKNLRRTEDKMFLSLASPALTATRKPKYPERKSAKKKGGGHGRKRE